MIGTSHRFKDIVRVIFEEVLHIETLRGGGDADDTVGRAVLGLTVDAVFPLGLLSELSDLIRVLGFGTPRIARSHDQYGL